MAKQRYINDATLPSQLKERFASLPFGELKQQIINGAKKGINEVRESFLNTRGVTCFSERNDDLLMWAHYGGQYKGFCLEFNTDKEPFTKLRRVKYVDSIPQINIVDFAVKKNHNKIFDDLYCTKSISWQHEREWRAIHAVAGTLFTYEPDALRAVYFGPDIEKQALEIVCLIIQGQNPSVIFFEGKRSEAEFKVEFRQFTYISYAEAKRKGLK